MLEKKYLLIIVSVLFTVLVALGLLVYVLNNSDNSYTTEKISVSTVDGSTILVNDFTVNSLVNGETLIVYYDSDFTIEFNADTQAFEIIFPGPITYDIQALRQFSEKKFMEILGIDKEAVCNLQVNQLVANIDSNQGSSSFPLSFCPNGNVFINQ